MIRLLTIILSLLSTAVVLSATYEQNSWLFLLPLTYGAFMKWLWPRQVKIGPGLTTLSVVLGLRYIITPPILQLEAHSGFNRKLLVSPEGIWLMLFEMLVIFLTIRFFYRRRTQAVPWQARTRISGLLVLTAVAVILIMYSLEPNMGGNTHFVLDAERINDVKVDIEGRFSMPKSWAETFLIIAFFILSFRKYEKTNGSGWFVLSLLIISYPCLFYSGSSRLSLLIPIISTVFLARKAYGERKSRTVTRVFVLYGLFAMTILSLYKFFGEGDVSNTSSMFSASTLNAYFGGPMNIDTGLEAFSRAGSSLYIFLVDSLRNAMGIAGYFADEVSSVAVFNHAFYGGDWSQDQIIPTIIGGLLYFNIWGCFIPTVLMTWATCYFDYKWCSTKDLFFAYLCARCAATIGWAVPASWMHLTTCLFNVFLPLYLIILCNQFFTRRRTLQSLS